MSKRIAIIGAGFVGLATAWHLLKRNPSVEIVIYDKKGIGGGASGIAAGLLHPYAGAHGKLNWKGFEGMQAAAELLKISSAALGTEVANFSGLIRVALSDLQAHDFKLASEKYADVRWMESDQVQQKVCGMSRGPGIFIKSAVVVNCQKYLEGLWQACQNLGSVRLEIAEIRGLDDLNHFDAIVVAAGASSRNIADLAHLKITAVKGQVLDLSWPSGLPRLTMPVNSQAYLVMGVDGRSCLAGATFEKVFEDERPDLAIAKSELMPKVAALMPDLASAGVLECRAGVRASTPDHKPVMMKVNEKCWVLTGMGSKGLLYHALYAESLSRELL